MIIIINFHNIQHHVQKVLSMKSSSSNIRVTNNSLLIYQAEKFVSKLYEIVDAILKKKLPLLWSTFS